MCHKKTKMNQSNWKTLVPAAKHNAVENALLGAFGSTEIDHIAPLTGGRSSALVYKVTAENKPYVIRLVTEIDALTDPNRHFICLNAAARQGIAPPVRYTNAQDAVSIVDFIEHAPLSTSFTTQEQLLGELASLVKATHSLPLFPPLVGFLDGVESLIERYKTLGVLPPAVLEEHFRYYEAIQLAYPRHDTNLVASHNDLNPTNILHNNGKIWLIDWEAAFANDRYVDLALVNIFFGAGEYGEEILLGNYFGDSLNDYHRARFFLMRQVCFMYVAMLFMHLVSVFRKPDSILDAGMKTISFPELQSQLQNGKFMMVSADDHLLFAKVVLNQSLSQMKTPRFNESLDIVVSQTS
ncbi:hypothetical protein EON83_01920 [bacterium]|nr:MAG: hypothetical protein EON83_01920 [bacterium]